MHLRPPSIDPGVSAGLWALGLALYLFVGMLAVGVGSALSLIVSAVAALGIFLYVRLYGRDADF